MNKRRKRRDIDEDDDRLGMPRDLFDDFFEFGHIDREFERMREYMDMLMRKAMQGELETDHQGPYVYGFTARIGPDGKPKLEEFGNTIHRRASPDEPPSIGEREPLTDVIESEDELAITLEIPGVEKDDIDLTVTDDKVSINVDTPQRRYFKEIPLNVDVDANSVKATYHNGVLDLTLKRRRKKEKKGKKVKIE